MIAHAAQARIDRDGRLVETDAAFGALNTRAGGAIGRPIAIPQVATIARLAQRLGILVSRPATVADGEVDRDLWVRAEPDRDGVRLAIAATGERAAVRPEDTQATARDYLLSGADWHWETDATLRLTHVAIDAGARYGFDAVEMLGAPITRLFALDQGDVGMLPILEALAARSDFEDQSAVLRDTNRAVRLAAIARRDSAGGFAGFVGATFMARGAGSPAPALTEAFAGRLDTALRSPLARIIATADSINAQADGPLAQDYVDYAADIASAGRHLMGLIDDLADLEAIERPDFSVAVEAIDLADLARRAAGLLTVRASDAGVTIARPATGEVLPATGEFRRALQILVNLIGNAVRYAPAGSSVTVSVERDGDRAVATVGDTGKGIATEDQARVFEKFARVDPREQGGSGLGLYIARRLARAMGGDLTVDSAQGEGARFRLTLPRG